MPKLIPGLCAMAATAVSMTLVGCTQTPPPNTTELTAFARCLTDNGVIMYGADWCSHCQRQKQLFGPAFAALTYVECPQDPERCVQAGVNGYPTWVSRAGKKVAGEQSLQSLAELSGCPVPK